LSQNDASINHSVKSGGTQMNIIALGIDIAKNVFQLHGVDANGKIVLQKKLNRDKLLKFIAQLPACKIGMESCSGSNYWAKQFQALGHEVKLISPQFVKPYVKSNKNDMQDAEAICEALTRPSMRFVSIKTLEQQDIQSVHRVRSRVIKERTALVNQIRGLLAEYLTFRTIYGKFFDLIQYPVNLNFQVIDIFFWQSRLKVKSLFDG